MATKSTFPLGTRIWFLSTIGLPLALKILAEVDVVSDGVGDTAYVFSMLSIVGFVGYFIAPSKSKLSFSVASMSALIFTVAVLWITLGSGGYISGIVAIISFIFLVSSGGKFLTAISSARY